jgi:hypothetical protein
MTFNKFCPKKENKTTNNAHRPETHVHENIERHQITGSPRYITIV